MSRSCVVYTALLALSLGVPNVASAGGSDCPRMYERGTLALDFNPAFVTIDRYDAGWGSADGLTVSSFFNVEQNGPMGPQFYERDLVAHIPFIGWIDPADFDPDTHVEVLPNDMVWPNEAVRAPDGVFAFEALVVPQGFHPAAGPGRLSVIDLEDPDRTEYVIHQSTQNFATGFTFPGDPNNSPRFYHRALFVDMDGDGLEDIVTARSGFRVVPSVYPPFSELVYFRNPGDALDPDTPWDEVVLWGGPAAQFLGPDIHLAAHDFEGDGVVEIVATHFFSGFASGPGGPPPQNGKISIYGAPEGGTWADVDASIFALPRVRDLVVDQGFPFEVEIVDLNRDGQAEILATNHQPDGCTPPTSSAVPGRVFAVESPASGDIFGEDWSTRILLDDIRPNPSPLGSQPPGRLAPGSAHAFHPVRWAEGWTKPWIVVGGDEASRVWVLRPSDPFDSENWEYDSAVVFDINDFYGENTTQTDLPDRPGVTISTIGLVATRYDRPGPFGRAELYIPVFEGREIQVLSFRRSWWGQPRIECNASPSACTQP